MIGMLDQKGATHPTFSPPSASFGPTAYKIIVDSDNKIMVVGSFTAYGDAAAGGIVKLKGLSD
jgi:hypothetical protein